MGEMIILFCYRILNIKLKYYLTERLVGLKREESYAVWYEVGVNKCRAAVRTQLQVGNMNL